MNKKFKTAVCTTLILGLISIGCGVNAASCPGDNPSSSQTVIRDEGSENLMSEITAQPVNVKTTPTVDQNVKLTDFSLKLLQNSMQEEENILVSPLSVLYALGMTANGADGTTLVQMEEIFGLSTEELNQYLYSYTHVLPQGNKYKLTSANGIWFRNRENLLLQEDFLQTNADWYDTALYRAPFDESTRQQINDWVKENTDGMIQNMLEEPIPNDAIMYLVNALAFDAQWENIYEDRQIREGIFTTADGTEQKAEMMYSEEYCYLEDENAVGFIKYYDDKSYAFMALLPDEGMSLTDYVNSLDGERLNQLITDVQKTPVYVGIPKFECEYSTELSDVLKAMGMTDAFDPEQADFSRIGSSAQGNICISRVLHKTYISVDEKGTKAGAATAVEMRNAGAMVIMQEVYLNRPFVYMLIDCQENLPVFIGTLDSLEQ